MPYDTSNPLLVIYPIEMHTWVDQIDIQKCIYPQTGDTHSA